MGTALVNGVVSQLSPKRARGEAIARPRGATLDSTKGGGVAEFGGGERWGNRPTSLWIAEDSGAALQLMVKRGRCGTASSISRRWSAQFDISQAGSFPRADGAR